VNVSLLTQPKPTCLLRLLQSVRHDKTFISMSDRMAVSVLYDSSQDSNISTSVDQAIENSSPSPQSPVTHDNYDSIPWELSQLEQQSTTKLQHNNRDPSPHLSVIPTKLSKDAFPAPDDSEIQDHSFSG
jgi:hypothetical protein